MSRHHLVADIDAPELECVSIDSTVDDALERMFETESPHLGVLDADGLVGVVSHRDVTRVLHITDEIDQADSLLHRSVAIAVSRSYPSVRPDDDLFVLFDELAESPYVIVEESAASPRILRDVGFHQFLRGEIQEFLLVEEIERTIRDIIRDSIEGDAESRLQETFESQELRTPTRIEDCSFRHYAIFVSARWELFEHRFDQPPDFVRELVDRVGEIRNRLFHFRATPDEEPLETDFLEFARDQLQYAYDNG